MGFFDKFKRSSRAEQHQKPQQPRRHHYNFAYKALPGLAFADPHLPLAFTSSTYSWQDLVAALESGGPFGRDVANHKLLHLWNEVGQKLPDGDKVPDRGLSAVGGEFGPKHSLVLVQMPEPLNDTEAYFVAVVYPKSWFEKPGAYEHSVPDLRCYLLAKSSTPGHDGSPAAVLRLVKKGGHGAVSMGIPRSLPAFLEGVLTSLDSPEHWITWVDSPTWNYFMRSPDDSEIHGAA